VGLFLACRHQPDPAGLTAEELNLVRSLRNQVVLAIRTK
jgi:GAF domain-containing protein